MNKNEIAQKLLELREKAYNQKLMIDHVDLGQLADMAYLLMDDKAKKKFESDTQSMLKSEIENDMPTDFVKVNGAWYVDALPNEIVIELADGTLKMAFLNPFRPLENDLKDYKGYHPRKCKGQPLPAYLYRFYGLTKSDETANEVIHIRLTPSEKERVQTAADGSGKNVSEFIRDYIRGL